MWAVCQLGSADFGEEPASRALRSLNRRHFDVLFESALVPLPNWTVLVLMTMEVSDTVTPVTGTEMLGVPLRSSHSHQPIESLSRLERLEPVRVTLSPVVASRLKVNGAVNPANNTLGWAFTLKVVLLSDTPALKILNLRRSAEPFPSAVDVKNVLLEIWIRLPLSSTETPGYGRSGTWRDPVNCRQN